MNLLQQYKKGRPKKSVFEKEDFGMNWSPILAFAVVAVAFGIGDVIAAKTKGVVSSIIVVILLFLLFGGGLHLLPADLMNQSGLMSLIPTFGMALILVNLGSMLDLNDLKREWKTVLVSLAGVAGIAVLYMTAGAAIFGREQAFVAMAPTAGGMAATMMLTEAANQANRSDLAAFVAAVMALQILIGLPISSFCLRKEANRFLMVGGHKMTAAEVSGRKINIRIFPSTPKILDIPSIHLARLAVVGFLAFTITRLTGLSSGVTFLVGGILFGAIGFLEPGALKRAGGEGLLMLATYASVTASFVGMTFAQFGEMLIPAISLLLMGAVGVSIFSSLVGKLLKWSPWLSIAVGLACMFGYPVTYAVAMEISAGVVKGKNFSQEEEERVVQHLLPKMIVAGTVSVSIASVLLAGFVIPILFG